MTTTHGMEEQENDDKTDPAPEPVLLDSAQAMERLGLSYRQLDRLRAMRRIGYYKRGGRLWYAACEVERVRQAFEVPALRPVLEMADGGR
jgi:hypothetical protein